MCTVHRPIVSVDGSKCAPTADAMRPNIRLSLSLSLSLSPHPRGEQNGFLSLSIGDAGYALLRVKESKQSRAIHRLPPTKRLDVLACISGWPNSCIEE